MKKLLILVIFGLLTSAAFSQEGDLRIHFLDVGECETILIQTPEGKNVLIDSGNIISGFKALEYLKEKGICDLEYFILTHPHLDHIGGAFFILQNLNVEHVYDNGQDLSEISKSCDIYYYYNMLIRGNRKYGVLGAGDELKIGDVSFDIKWPLETNTSLDFNVNSLVIMIQYNNFRCLLTGDLTILGERELIRLGSDLRADVFKVGHHGSIDASSKEFLMKVSPKVPIISVDSHNRRGCPKEQILERLRDVGSRIYKTFESGNIVITVDNKGDYSIKTKGESKSDSHE